MESDRKPERGLCQCDHESHKAGCDGKVEVTVNFYRPIGICMSCLDGKHVGFKTRRVM